tara:strand:+ start:622 stop:1056 length:435 start_codon:yes stop_codon:yes gene_type:complete
MVSLDELEMNRKDKKIAELEAKAAFRATARANREKKLMTTIETRDRKIKKLEEQLAALNGVDDELRRLKSTWSNMVSAQRERDAMKLYFLLLGMKTEFYPQWLAGILQQSKSSGKKFDEIISGILTEHTQNGGQLLKTPPMTLF